MSPEGIDHVVGLLPRRSEGEVHLRASRYGGQPSHWLAKRVNTALERLREIHAPLADHLRDCIQMGASFTYTPSSEITWRT